jgi:hypothetical protein
VVVVLELHTGLSDQEQRHFSICNWQ